MRRAVALVALGLALATGLSLVSAAPASAKSFSIDRMVVEANLRADASMTVVEHLTYTFRDGVFNVGDRDIPPGDYEIVDMRASEGGQPLETISSDPSSFEWDLGGATGTHTYDIAYTVVGAAAVGPDVGELAWKWIGDDFPRVGSLEVTLRVPGDGSGLRAWAHGPLQGVVRPSGTTVTFQVDDVPEGRFVEGRVALPSTAFTVTPSGAPRLPTILSEEKERADAANRDRVVKRTLAIASPVLALGGIVVFLVLWGRWGKEPDAPPDVGDYWREIPPERPAVITAVEPWGTVPHSAFGATLVDLAQRGYLTITEQRRDRLILKDEVDFLFTPTPRPDDGLTEYEKALLLRLFPSGQPITQAQVVDDAKKQRTDAVAFWNTFAERVKEDFDARGFQPTSGRAKVYLLHLLTLIVLTGVGVLALAKGAVLGVVPIVVAGVLLLLTLLLRQRTPAGRRKLAEVRGLRRFLKDFSRLEDAVVGDMILYERYLVYAVALGVADELVEGLRLRVPEIASGATTFAPWYVGSHLGDGGRTAGSGFEGLASIGSFASSFSAATAAAFSPPSSSSGSGGGFSGGGGGGGGGGGAGAH